MSEATFVDATGGKVTVTVWDKAYEMFDSLSLGAGVLILGCKATVQDGGVKLDIWPGAHISTSGEQAQSLACLNVLTAKFLRGEQLGAQSLTSVKTRMNARGVLRLENGVAKRYVTEVESTPLEAVVSMTAMQIMVDDEVTDDGRQ